MLAVFTVDNLDDGQVAAAGDAPGTLRQAIFDANNLAGADTIEFAEGLTGTITLTEGELDITDSVAITGPGARQLVLEAFDPTPEDDNADGSRIFKIDNGLATAIDVSISGLMLTGGDVTNFGGAILSLENLTIVDSIITGNSASAGGLVAAGGGIYSNHADLTIENSTISNNRVFHNGAALGGGIGMGNGDLTLRNSTVSGNRASAPTGSSGGDAYGGGIVVGGGTHQIVHSTIANNQVFGMTSLGGGLFIYGTPDITLDHTIVGNNFASTGREISSTGAVTARFSLIEFTTGWILDDGGNNILNQDPGLSFALVGHSESWPVHALLSGSPAIDAGDPSLVAGSGGVPDFDQRDAPFTRVADGDANSTAVIDIGAYERQTVPGLSLVVDTTSDESDGEFGAGELSLREAIALANGSVGADTITFAPELSGQTILLTSGELTIIDSVAMDAASQAGVVIIDASGNDPTPDQNLGDGSRIFSIDDGPLLQPLTVSISGLYLTGGDVSGDGGAIDVEGMLHLSHTTIHGNHATRHGGGVRSHGGSNNAVTIDNSTISGNVAAGGSSSVGGAGFSYQGGGGLYLGGDTEIKNSTISGNRVVGGDNLEGGGIVAVGEVTIRHSTISGNSISGANSRGGNIFNFGSGVGLVLNHTIVANGSASSGNDIASPFDPITANSSLIEDVSGLTVQGSGNVTGSDPLLGPLTDNGGPTKTHALLPGSPAIDAGQFSFTPPPNVDQRGGDFVRLFNGDDDPFTIIDIGAYERQTVAGLSLVVDTIVDENDGDYGPGDLSLREAIGLANGSIGSDTITFAPELVGKTIVLLLGELRVVDDVVIDAASLGGKLTIDASGNDPTPTSSPSGDGTRVFNVDDGDAVGFLDVELRGLTLTGGDILDFVGGGAVLNAENLTVADSTITGNASLGSLFGTPGNYVTIGGRGGGIHVTGGGMLNLLRSTVDSNTAAYGGGLSIDEGMLTISSSTVSGNTATVEGGGLWATGSTTTVTANHSTIARNTVSIGLLTGSGGGVFADNDGSISLNHTIVADNSALTGADIFSADPVAFSSGMVENGSGFTPSGGPQFIGVDPLLGPLADNGGPTQTHALLAGSPAIDVGNLSFTPPPNFDQRGEPFARRVDGNNDGVPRIDLGAYERQTLPGLNLIVDTTDDLTNGDFSAGDLSLREAVGLANGSVGSDTITFAPALSGATILLVQGEMMIVDELTIDGLSVAQNLIVDASGSDPTPEPTDFEDLGDGSRIFSITDGVPGTLIDVELRGLTLTGGDVTGDGGAILSVENLTIVASTVARNAAVATSTTPLLMGGNGGGFVFTGGNGGGIAARFDGFLSISDSTISGNLAAGGVGGGINASNEDLTLRNSTVSDNFAVGSGGGVFISGLNATSVEHSTISDNRTGSNGGGISVASGGVLSIDHSIVANNEAFSGPDIRSDDPVPVIYSLVESTDGFTPTGGAPRITGQDPMLGPLADNGGRTQTHAILPGSPVIDQGELGIASPPAFDQRGAPFARIVDGDEDTFSVIDMGAYEFSPAGPELLGDFNNDGSVDAADYVTFRVNEGTAKSLPNDGGLGGTVGEDHYNLWRANFGNTAPSPGPGSANVSSAPMTTTIAAEPVAVESVKQSQSESPQRSHASSMPSAAVNMAFAELAFRREAATENDLQSGREQRPAATSRSAAGDQLLLLLSQAGAAPFVVENPDESAVWDDWAPDEESEDPFAFGVKESLGSMGERGV